MKKGLAFLSLGLFGYMGYAVWIGQSIGGSSSKARLLENLIIMATDSFGAQMTSILLYSAGIILAFAFLISEAYDSHD